jgi:UDP-N-acetylmuramoyl-L-alanyl-D-glutamate--2,6-diaminopimelate ligase
MHRSYGKPLSYLTGHLLGARLFGKGDPVITGIAYDSRDVEAGHLFFALDGIHTDGHSFIPAALEAGAAAIVCRRIPETVQKDIVYIQVNDTRKALSQLSAAFFDYPSRSLQVVGVTGTDGKSSTVYFIHQLLEMVGRKPGLLSTVSFFASDMLVKNSYRQSTPEAPILHELLAQMRDAGKEIAVIEATSHGLSERTARLQDVEFDAGVLTNVTHEHLEFHGTWENYLHDKTNLFRALSPSRSNQKGSPCFGVANKDDRSFPYVKAHCKAVLYSYSIQDPEADLYGKILRSDLEGNTFSLYEKGMSTEVRIPMPGSFTVENILAAVLTVSHLENIPALELAKYLPTLQGVRGRMTPIRKGQPFSVLVDYAHTPGAFEKLFPLARTYTKGKLIAVFGSGGERDREKRPLQGRIASQYADILILTNEDPRLEDPMEILREIAQGCRGKTIKEDLFLIPDRLEGIRTAFLKAQEGDTVLLLGKGHEGSIILSTGPLPWDEIEKAEELLEEMGYGGQKTGA